MFSQIPQQLYGRLIRSGVRIGLDEGGATYRLPSGELVLSSQDGQGWTYFRGFAAPVAAWKIDPRRGS